MLVIPGGADLPYCQALNGEGNKKIQQFVRKGGKFLGICAGGYYGLQRCEFEVGNPRMEVTGPRELEFYPGTCKGCTFKGFVYESHHGARATPLVINPKHLDLVGETKFNNLNQVMNYYNGGGLFVGASKMSNVDVLASYANPTDVEKETADAGNAAIVHCKVGKGDAILCGTHPEFVPSLLKSFDSDEGIAEEMEHLQSIMQNLSDGDADRRLLMKLILKKIGLKVNEDPSNSVPKLTPMFVSSHLNPGIVNLVAQDFRENCDLHNGNELHDQNDTFVFHDESEDNLSMVQEGESHLVDAHGLPKHVKFLNRGSLPDMKTTPYFNMSLYFSCLEKLVNNPVFGSVLAYGEVTSSTSTLMDKNPEFLTKLPTGFTFTATTQIAGRGRGGNVWVNPKGVMASSVLFKIDPSNNPRYNSNIVTLQYLCGLVFVESVLQYGTTEFGGPGVGYEDIPIKIKWPNDLYILKPEFFNNLADKDHDNSNLMVNDEEKYTKVSGAIINSQYLNGIFHLVWGGGLNVSNEAPTTSLNTVLERMNELRAAKGLEPLPPFKHEALLAKFMQILNILYPTFEKSGMKPFLPLYYKRWFHSNQKVSVDVDGHKNKFCTVRGITDDYGLLLVTDDITGERLELQPDGNSFDIFKGMVYKKIAYK